jgi:hypothetical protein
VGFWAYAIRQELSPLGFLMFFGSKSMSLRANALPISFCIEFLSQTQTFALRYVGAEAGLVVCAKKRARNIRLYKGYLSIRYTKKVVFNAED